MSQNETKLFFKILKVFFMLAFVSASQVSHAGGVSGGGGNAVGKVLFDFYENANTEKIPVAHLATWRESLGNMLLTLEKEFPSVNGVSLRQQLVNASEQKRWLLETKPLLQEGACLNASMLNISGQKVIACQTKRYVRISYDWFKSTDEKNANGVILHEMYLAYLMTLQEELKLDPDTRDEIVRDLNRASFDSDYADLKKILIKDLKRSVLDKNSFQALQYLNSNRSVRQEQYCQGLRIILNDDEKTAMQLLEPEKSVPEIYQKIEETQWRNPKSAEEDDYCLMPDVKAKRIKSELQMTPPACQEKLTAMAQTFIKEARIESDEGMNNLILRTESLSCWTQAQLEDHSVRTFSKKFPMNQSIRNMSIQILETAEGQNWLESLTKHEPN